MTSLSNPIMQRFRREQTELYLRRGNGMDSMRTAYRRRTGLANPNSSDITLFNKLSKRPNASFKGYVGVDTGTLEDIDLLDPGEDGEGLVHRGSDALRATVRGVGCDIVGSFDTKYNFVGVFRVLREVVLEQV